VVANKDLRSLLLNKEDAVVCSEYGTLMNLLVVLATNGFLLWAPGAVVSVRIDRVHILAGCRKRRLNQS